MRHFRRSSRQRKGKRTEREGLALLAILVLIVMLSLIAYSFTLSMENQYRLARIQEDQVQAKLAAHSGIELVASILSLPIDRRRELGGLDNNLEVFQDIALETDSSRQSDSNDGWSFSVLALQSVDLSVQDDSASFLSTDTDRGGNTKSSSYVFGLQNESAKIHLPTLAEWDRSMPGHARRVLESLPGATSPMIERLLRRINSADAAMREDPGFQWLWLGEDLNRNFQVDPLEVAFRSMKRAELNGAASVFSQSQEQRLEQDSTTFSSIPSRDQSTDRGMARIYGWQQVLTWENGERNESVDGRAKIFLNSQNLQELHQNLRERLPEEWADFIIAVRQFGLVPGVNRSSSSSKSNDTSSGSSEATYQPDFSVAPVYSLRSPLELIGAVVEIPNSNTSESSNSSKRRLISPISAAIQADSNYLGRLLDSVTADGRTSFPGRVDVNHAPYWVLIAVPGMISDLAERIIQWRQNNQAGHGRIESNRNEIPSDATISWLFEQGLVDLQQLMQLEPYITARADVYSCQVIGYIDDERPVYRATVTVDARSALPVIRDLSTWHDWDRGFEVEQLQTALLR